jgi:hypothetical protein
MSDENRLRTLSEEEIDNLVAVQADDDAAWEAPVRVHKAEPAVVTGEAARRSAVRAALR